MLYMSNNTTFAISFYKQKLINWKNMFSIYTGYGQVASHTEEKHSASKSLHGTVHLPGPAQTTVN